MNSAQWGEQGACAPCCAMAVLLQTDHSTALRTQQMCRVPQFMFIGGGGGGPVQCTSRRACLHGVCPLQPLREGTVSRADCRRGDVPALGGAWGLQEAPCGEKRQWGGGTVYRVPEHGAEVHGQTAHYCSGVPLCRGSDRMHGCRGGACVGPLLCACGTTAAFVCARTQGAATPPSTPSPALPTHIHDLRRCLCHVHCQVPAVNTAMGPPPVRRCQHGNMSSVVHVHRTEKDQTHVLLAHRRCVHV